MEKSFHILPNLNFALYQIASKVNLDEELGKLPLLDENGFDFNFYIASAATYSSNIEGNSVNFDTYLKHKELGFNIRKKEIEEIDNLVEAYKFAQNSDLTFQNICLAHKIYSKGIVPDNELGKIRTQKVGVRSEGKLIYLAIEPDLVQKEIEKLFKDIQLLIVENLTIDQVFYFASLIHLVFVYIHPFVDGNGRATRLLEKWFLAKKLGVQAWHIESEKYYYLNRDNYYNNLRMGGNYYVINYNLSMPFLLMLPNAIKSV